MAKQPIRVLYVCHDGDKYGAQQSLSLLVSHLDPERVLPFVSIARSGPLNEDLAQIPNVTILSHQRLQWMKHDPRGVLQRFGDIVGLFLSMPGRTMALCHHIRRHKIDIVHTNSAVSLEGALAARLAGVPHIWHIRELFRERSPKLHPLFSRTLTRRLIHALSFRVICISEAVKQQFRSHLKKYPDKYRLVYNAAKVPPYSLMGDGYSGYGKFTVGYVGRLSEGKRFHDLLEAMALMKTHHLELKVAGRFVDRPFEKKVHTLIKHLGLSDRITFLGYQDDLRALYNSLDVLVLPSLNEPFGRVIIEGMLAGVPCIAARSGGIPEIIEDGQTGFLFDPADAGSLALTLKEAMASPEHLRIVRERAGRMVRERFSIETQLKALYACYDEALPHRYR